MSVLNDGVSPYDPGLFILHDILSTKIAVVFFVSIAIIAGLWRLPFIWRTSLMHSFIKVRRKHIYDRNKLKQIDTCLSDVRADYGYDVVSSRQYTASLKLSGTGSIRNVVLSLVKRLTGVPKSVLIPFVYFLPDVFHKTDKVEEIGKYLSTIDVLLLPSAFIVSAIVSSGLQKLVYSKLTTEIRDAQEKILQATIETLEAIKATESSVMSEFFRGIEMINKTFDRIPRADILDNSVREYKPVDNEFLPDLYFGVGAWLKDKETPREKALYSYLASILNKLSLNVTGGQEEYEILVGERKCRTAVEFIHALQENDINVEGSIISDFTSMGMYLSVRSPEGEYIPMLAPFVFDTELVDLTTNERLWFPLGHGCMTVRVCIPPMKGRPSIKMEVQFYQSIDGFAGFFPDLNFDFPWLCRNTHRHISAGRIGFAVDCASVYAAAANKVSSDNKWAMGGYGMLGVCNDSAAAVEACLFGKTTIYPLSGFPRARVHMAHCVRSLDLANSPHLSRTLLKLPTDISTAPIQQTGLIHRMKCTSKGLVESKIFPNIDHLLTKLDHVEKLLLWLEEDE